MEKKEGVQGGPSVPAKEGGDSEDVWRDCMEVEDEAESRKKLDEQRKNMQKELREVDRLVLFSKEMQECIKESLQHQLQDVETRRNELMPEHQKVQKRTQKIQSLQDKGRNLQKESTAAKEEMWKIREEVDWKEERFRLLSDKVGKKQNGRCGNGSRTSGIASWRRKKSQAVECCLETMVEHIFAMGTGPSKAEPVSSWCYQRQAGSIKVHQRVVWSLIFIVFGVHLVKAEVQEDQANKEIVREVHPDHQDGIPWMKKRMTMLEDWCLRQKRKTVREGTPAHQKEIARVRTQGPSKQAAKRWGRRNSPDKQSKQGPKNLGSTR